MIEIHGKQYVQVHERVKLLNDSLGGSDTVEMNSEVLLHEPVVIKVTITITRSGMASTYTGISAANPSKAIEKQSPYEVAETSACGRALGFAGFGSVDGIASADEMVKTSYADKVNAVPAPKEKYDAAFNITVPSESRRIALRDVPTTNPANHPCTKCGGPTSLAVVGPTDKNGKPNKNAGKPYRKCPTHKFSEWADQPITPIDDPFEMGV